MGRDIKSIEGIERRLDQTRFELEEARKRNVDLHRQILGIKSSISYRVGFFLTAPIRYIYDFAKQNRKSVADADDPSFESLGDELGGTKLNGQTTQHVKDRKSNTENISMEGFEADHIRFGFDESYYRSRYSDLQKITGRLGLFQHFKSFGIPEGRTGSFLYDPQFVRIYYKKNDLTNKEVFEFWRDEVLYKKDFISPLFNLSYYTSCNADVAKFAKGDRIKAINHWLVHGIKEGRAASPFFDVKFYIDNNIDVQKAHNDHRTILIHWQKFGLNEGRASVPWLDYQYIKEYLHQEHNNNYTILQSLIHWWGSFPVKPFLGVDPSSVDESQKSKFLNVKKPVKYRLTSIKKVERKRQVLNWTDHQFYEIIEGDRNHVEDGKNVMLVAHNVGKYIYGGERSFIDITQMISAEFNLLVVIPRKNEEFVSIVKSYANFIVVMKYGWWSASKMYDDPTVLKFQFLITKFGIDLIHVNTIMLLDALKAAELQGIPSLVHVRELISRDKYLCEHIGLTDNEIIDVINDNATRLISNSVETKNEFDMNDMGFVIPNVVADELLDLDYQLDPLSIKVGIISSNIEKKGITDFAEIAKRISKTHPHVHFGLYGQDTPLVRQIMKEVESSADKVNLVFEGYRTSVIDAHRDIDILMNLSWFAESFGRTVAEAMAAGRPVVAYDWGAVPELVDPGITGYLAEHRNIDDAVEKLTKLLDNPTSISKMGANGKKKVIKNNIKASVGLRLRAAYQSTLSEFPGSESAMLPAPVEITEGENRMNFQLNTHDKLRVGYFVWHFPVQSETFVINEINELLSRNIDVVVFCRQHLNRNHPSPVACPIVRVTSPEELTEKIISYNRTIMHSIFVYPTVSEFLWPACEAAEVPFTFAAHAAGIFKYENIEKNRIAEISRSPYCSKIFVPGNFHFDYLLDLDVEKSKLAINPQVINTTSRYNSSVSYDYKRDKSQICLLARFTEKKGIDTLIKAAALIDENIVVNIYGYGDEEPMYLELIKNLKLKNVNLCGGLKSNEEVIHMLESHDAMILPCRRAKNGDMDGIPTVLIEALAFGTPVIASKVSSIPDLIEDFVTGILLTDPESEVELAEKISLLYRLPEFQLNSIIQRGKERILDKFNTKKLVSNLVRIWNQKDVAITIVSYNNLDELKEVIERIVKYTTWPYRLVVVDNKGDADVRYYLKTVEGKVKNADIIYLEENVFVGPGTNVSYKYATCDYNIYVCGREGFVFKRNWEIDFVNYMEHNEDVGLAGYQTYAPSYFYGYQYEEGVALFDKFRNKDFSKKNKYRHFTHVQGGFFIARMSMVDQIGGFSDEVAHNYTDVEYSYYVESTGWKLGTLPGLVSIFNKTKPGLLPRISSNVKAIHPGNLTDIPVHSSIIDDGLNICPVCEVPGEIENSDEKRGACRSCGSDAMSRLTVEYLTRSNLLFRRLKSLSVNLHPSISEYWKAQFQGVNILYTNLSKTLNEGGGLDNRSGSFDVVFMTLDSMMMLDDQKFMQEVIRVLNKVGIFIVAVNMDLFADIEERSPMEDLTVISDAVRDNSEGRIERKEIYTSEAVNYCAENQVLLIFKHRDNQ